jgi:hypothetical protein
MKSLPPTCVRYRESREPPFSTLNNNQVPVITNNFQDLRLQVALDAHVKILLPEGFEGPFLHLAIFTLLL